MAIEALTSSIVKATKKHINDAPFDRSYNGFITEVLFDENTAKNNYYYNRYKIAYGDSEKTFLINDGFKHAVGESVKVYIPSNNLSNRYAEPVYKYAKKPRPYKVKLNSNVEAVGDIELDENQNLMSIVETYKDTLNKDYTLTYYFKIEFQNTPDELVREMIYPDGHTIDFTEFKLDE